MTKMLKSQQNRLSLPIKNQNQTTKPSKYMTKANKTVLIIFCPCVYMHRPDHSPSLSQSVTLNGPPPPSLKRDVINEWPHTACCQTTEMDHNLIYFLHAHTANLTTQLSFVQQLHAGYNHRISVCTVSITGYITTLQAHLLHRAILAL